MLGATYYEQCQCLQYQVCNIYLLHSWAGKGESVHLKDISKQLD